MTIAEFKERAEYIEAVADNYLGVYENFYDFSFLSCGNIEFEIIKNRMDDLLKILPDTMLDFPIYIQFAWCDGAWKCCVTKSIHDVGLYKKMREKGYKGNTTVGWI